VNAFLSHAPPDWEDCYPSEEAIIAEVDWYAVAVPTEASARPVSLLGLPSVERLDDCTVTNLANREAGPV